MRGQYSPDLEGLLGSGQKRDEFENCFRSRDNIPSELDLRGEDERVVGAKESQSTLAFTHE